MSCKVTYNDQYIRPAPSLSVQAPVNRAGNGENLSPAFTLTLTGTILPTKGSPTASGTFANNGPEYCEPVAEGEWATALNAKLCALRTLFNQDHKELTIGTEDGDSNIRCYPRLLDFSTEDSYHVSHLNYTITLEADNIFCGSGYLVPSGQDQLVKSYDESWEFSFDDENVLQESGDNRIFNVTHTISAVGKYNIGATGLIYSTPLESAQDFVCARIGDNSLLPSVCIANWSNHSGLPRYNYVDTHTSNVSEGSYSVTENWVFASGGFNEEYTVNIEESVDTSCPTVSIDGTITGYTERSGGVIVTSKFANANSYFLTLGTSGILNRAEDISGIDLDDDPISSTVGKNVRGGVITYNYTFKRIPVRRLASAKKEKITISNNWDEDITAVITLLDKGDIIQKVNGTGTKHLTTSLNIDAVYPCGTGMHVLGPRFTAAYSGEIQDVVNLYNPTGYPEAYIPSVSVESQNENWDESDGAYTYAVNWIWTKSGDCN